MKFFFSKKSQKKAAEEPVKIEAVESSANEGEIAAVICLALRLYSYRHMEQEETLATIQKAIRPYSPWNSKIYNMKQQPFHRPAPRRIK